MVKALAETAIADAAAGNARSLGDAALEMTKGAAETKPGGMIEHYKNAWKNAQDAVQ